MKRSNSELNEQKMLGTPAQNLMDEQFTPNYPKQNHDLPTDLEQMDLATQSTKQLIASFSFQ